MPTPEHFFGLELKRTRLACGVSQQELAFRSDIHWSYVSQLERGKKSPSLGVVFRLARALEVPASTLILAVEDQMSA